MAERNLVVTTLPNRSGLYLAIQEGSVIKTIARFTRGEESAQELVDWCVKAGIRYENPRSEMSTPEKPDPTPDPGPLEQPKPVKP
jgi:hypothetical protein